MPPEYHFVLLQIQGKESGLKDLDRSRPLNEARPRVAVAPRLPRYASVGRWQPLNDNIEVSHEDRRSS